MNRRWLVILLCSLMVTAVPVGGHAQGIGGLVRKKVAEVAGTDAKNEAPRPDAASAYGGNVLELTEPVMKGFMNGVAVELALLEEFADVLDTYGNPADLERCRQETAMSPEGMEIVQRLANVPDNASAEELQRMMQRLTAELAALTKKRCGPDVNEDWPQSRRRERVAAIVAQAAAAAGAAAAAAPGPLPYGGASDPDGFDVALSTAPGRAEMVADSMTLEQYGISWERAENYCLLLESGAIHPLQPVVHPAEGGKVYWVYSEAEARAIEPHCEEVIKARDRRNQLRVYLYWDASSAEGKPSR